MKFLVLVVAALLAASPAFASEIEDRCAEQVAAQLNIKRFGLADKEDVLRRLADDGEPAFIQTLQRPEVIVYHCFRSLTWFLAAVDSRDCRVLGTHKSP